MAGGSVTGYESLPLAVKEAAERNLTRKQRDVLRLHLGGMSVRGIARTFGIAEPTAREHLRRAVDNLAPFYGDTKDAA